MAKYRNALPQLSGGIFLTDGGLETTLVFHDRIELKHFAAFDLMKRETGRARIRDYYALYAAMARANRTGFIFESPTWRANRDWGTKLGYSEAALAEVNRRSIELLAELRQHFETPPSPMVISGNIGPRGDGYDPGCKMSAVEAEIYHAAQIATFRRTEADMVSAFTLNYVEEAIGIVRAAAAAEMPVVISFTVETDGRLPTGQSLGSAITEVDEATDSGAAYFMVNCAYPTHLKRSWELREPWVKRVRGLRANASNRSHAELDQATALDAGDPVELGRQYRELRALMPQLTVLGGCCGTDHRHVQEIALSCVAHRRAALNSRPLSLLEGRPGSAPAYPALPTIGGWNERPMSHGKYIQVSCDTSVTKVSISGRPMGLA
jgi:homocysteine S-methyltransferase